ncbi:hypothetical protein BHM03_00020288 [Ensete ventricosum]|nr:hypothetical protein BHM03_00020288 [Ensete ventricosum]
MVVIVIAAKILLLTVVQPNTSYDVSFTDVFFRALVAYGLFVLSASLCLWSSLPSSSSRWPNLCYCGRGCMTPNREEIGEAEDGGEGELNHHIIGVVGGGAIEDKVGDGGDEYIEEENGPKDHYVSSVKLVDAYPSKT